MRSFILSVTFLTGAFLCGPNVVLAQSDFAAGWFSPAQSTLPSIEIVGADSVRVRSY